MSVEIKDVKWWMTLNGVAHVVDSARGGWTHTICQSLVSGMPDDCNRIPKRVCRTCRERLKACILIEVIE